MPQSKRYSYQTTVLISDHDGEWIDAVVEYDDMDKAHVLRMVIAEGRNIIEASKHPEELFTSQDSYQKGVVRYGYRAVPILTADTGEWIKSTCARYGLKRSIVIRTAISLGRDVIERHRRAARKIAA